MARGRKIEFVIFRFALYSDKRLKTGVLPKAIRSVRRLRQRDSETHQIPFENISKSECVVLCPTHTCFDFFDGWAACLRMAREHGSDVRIAAHNSILY